MLSEATTERGISILLVEDDFVDAMAFQRALNRQKLASSVYRALDGIEALELLQSSTVPKPYLILLDLSMPRMGGFEFLNSLREHRDLKTDVVFVFTTSGDEKDRANAYEKNVAGYIVKKGLLSDFAEVVTMLDHYCHVVTFP